LINTIGPYNGTRPIIGTDPVTFDIEADGAWTLVLEPIKGGGEPPFSGKGDDVSSFFAPPQTGPWEFSHDGKRNFVVKLHCSDGTPQLVQNRIGEFEGSGIVRFGKAPCYWEVTADGNWSLAPR
jgi:hypothetical protein